MNENFVEMATPKQKSFILGLTKNLVEVLTKKEASLTIKVMQERLERGIAGMEGTKGKGTNE